MEPVNAIICYSTTVTLAVAVGGVVRRRGPA